MAGSRRSIALRVQVALTVATVVANLIGALTVFVLLVFVLPTASEEGIGVANAVAVPAYVAGAVVVGALWGTRRVRSQQQWFLDGRLPDAREQRWALRAPFRILVVVEVLWAVAVALFTLLNGLRDADLIAPVAFTVSLGGITTGATAYLLSERVLRPVAAVALSSDPPSRPLVPGVTARSLLAWGLGSAVPVLGLGVTAIYALTGDEVSADRLAVTVLALGGVTVLVGLFTTLLAARATAAAVQAVRAGLTAVESGDLGVRIPVFDGTEVGLLQAGFNRMADGLAERERIRDLFGRHVGEGVARSAIAGGVELGGEVREVGVVFVDVVGSTELAASRPATEVVDALNRFFAVVIDVVHDAGGLVNKFEGDAVLAVFGAPAAVPDPAGAALAAGRVLAARLAAEVPDLAAGVGVSFGPAVAGNVGAEDRYEYTVIGDPVNEAARLTDVAKTTEGCVVAAGRAVDAAAEDERRRWRSTGDAPHLRGRPAPTPTWVPATSER